MQTKKRIKVSSAKAKGRKLQKDIAQRISTITNIPCGKDLDIESRQMGGSGVDVCLRGKAKELFPFSIECFSGETLVLTKNGYKLISDIKIGDNVFTSKSRFRKVINVMSRNVNEFINLKSNISSEVVSVTEEHPFETFNKEFIKASKLNYTSSFFSGIGGYELSISKFKLPKQVFKSKILKDHKHITCACGCGEILERYDSRGRERKFQVGHSGKWTGISLPKDVILDEDLLYIFGWYIAEGDINNNCVRWTLGSTELDYAKKIVEIVFNKFGIKASLKLYKSTYRISASSKLLSKFFIDLFNTGSTNKKLGKFIFLKRDLLKVLIRSYFLGDGCVREKFARCETVSRLLANEIHFSLLRLGILSRISIARKTSYNTRKHDLYSIQISKSSLYRFKKLMNNENFRFIKFEINYDDTCQIFDFSNGRVYTKVENKDIINKNINVFNLEIEEDETYIINGGIIVHNCKSQESWSIHEFIKQAKENQLQGTDWILFCKRSREEPVVIMDTDAFFRLYKKVLEK